MCDTQALRMTASGIRASRYHNFILVAIIILDLYMRECICTNTLPMHACTTLPGAVAFTIARVTEYFPISLTVNDERRTRLASTLIENGHNGVFLEQ